MGLTYIRLLGRRRANGQRACEFQAQERSGVEEGVGIGHGDLVYMWRFLHNAHRARLTTRHTAAAPTQLTGCYVSAPLQLFRLSRHSLSPIGEMQQRNIVPHSFIQRLSKVSFHQATSNGRAPPVPHRRRPAHGAEHVTLTGGGSHSASWTILSREGQPSCDRARGLRAGRATAPSQRHASRSTAAGAGDVGEG